MEHRSLAPILAILLLAALACAPAAMTPPQRALYLQTQVIDALGALQTAAINAHATLNPDTGMPVLDEAMTRSVVRATVRGVEIARLRPDAWRTTLRGLLAGLEAGLTAHDAARLSPYLAAVRLTLDAMEPQP